MLMWPSPVVEAAVLLLVTWWATWLLSNAMQSASPVSAQLQWLPMTPLLALLNGLMLAASACSMRSIDKFPQQLQLQSRRERDPGLVVGCVLPPLVLLSRFLLPLSQSGSVSEFALLYTWISISIGISAVLKTVVLPSADLRVAAVVDLVLVTLLSIATGIEADLRYVLPALCRWIVGFVFTHGMRVLPRSFTIGEALLVAQGVGLCAFDLLLFTAAQIIPEAALAFTEPWQVSSMAREDHVLALQVGVLGAIMICVTLAPSLRAHGAPSPNVIAADLPMSASVAFIARLLGAVLFIVYPWSCVALGTWNPFAWLVAFLLEQPSRWQLIAYWLACLVVMLPIFTVMADRLALRNIIARKLFHLLVVLMFVPAFFLDAAMLSLSYGVALSVFCLVECIRSVSLPPFGRSIAVFMKSFIDHREGGRVILTHTYLLLGCALPLWLANSVEPVNTVAANAGILALGVGDAMAAAVGSTYGSRKWFGSKTIEGTLAIFVSMALASVVFHDFHVRSLDGDHIQLVLFLLGLALTSLLEAVTSQIDNLVLPLFFYTVCSLVACHRS